VLRIGSIAVRAALAVLVLGTAFVGLAVTPEAQLVTVLALAVAAIVVERRTQPAAELEGLAP
jgi:TRAP-type mannitol/chloroaromatic compound transport system permease large subunit